jgi:hypothetical protein
MPDGLKTNGRRDVEWNKQADMQGGRERMLDARWLVPFFLLRQQA